jgi:DNA-binding NarL/FixJ family response regulator
MKRTTDATVHRPARVLVVDDHPLVREGLVARIAAQPDLEICGQGTDSDEALTAIRDTRPAIVIIDLALKRGSGLDLIKRAKELGDPPKMLVVSAYDESLFAERALRAGAQGYINKQELQGSIIDAIRAVLRGELYLSAAITQRLAKQALAGQSALHGVDALTDREIQVFELIGRGNPTRAIAEQLHLSVHTIESHREKIRIKLNLANGAELMRHAVQWILENSR